MLRTNHVDRVGNDADRDQPSARRLTETPADPTLAFLSPLYHFCRRRHFPEVSPRNRFRICVAKNASCDKTPLPTGERRLQPVTFK